MNTLLLIEDDKLLGEGLVSFFQSHGYHCLWAQNSAEAKKQWFQADLVILDRQLSDGDSLQHLPHWLMLKAVPVIVLTAKIEVDQKIEGLMAGAKDYMTKPFSNEELLARVVTQLRPIGGSVLAYSGVRIQLAERLAFFNEQEVSLKPKEFQLLVLLVQNQGRVFHRDELLNKIWGYQAFPSTRTVDNHILRLRQKLPVLNVETHRGVGYRLIKEAE
ncbi:putative TWO-COMPONENT SYSTEM SENSOR HISTIDINE KINASE/RESPONSE REGULATOR [Vibrio nigripulchritudo SO65]|uniref:response regulator transcription factor n=1 Tax=Vibrio nigripulchritudo TaxID=28173 RepID=UPI0003B2066F|nr:response regulator transcription factor [Vibrio nigripulchritudo]CCN34745.1 putative TWO-COMPONENT SYSTEM SENSOR HISTIDINE KINASE/RESPONSE REGULATOR [Vibrio nigripulchritudo AM115]CCN43724.1 putative TWO-COMPONENT SYSTEM SENSOR HISTIDINE KINASE/RESPONSE REGULATOR [Vibrio nigripulchritudo FTn2]CCN65238.1 putative TWO-COMPONENT SYSTEM SENSOR HISTIDINE KINASE/RESPONSE REGULATOR [Vibrio nigripulchritudo POn4]CCN74933.1 putative TWO-COMPONENT SYSTEM SENSOR HISTIDINE KINASE/RESPONSE REGULATOR [Vib